MSTDMLYKQETQLLHPKEVAAELGVTPATIWRAIRLGNLPAVRLGERGRYRVRRAALDAFLEDVHPRETA